ncbi:hypothetical protein ACFYWN_46360 [Streptomyces sp. NPDC002917]|uniref:DUF7224 domain-containing protein n=1 Tax=Streptomyces sp. NPDC002917 TaxID=3364671 RepID=UPI0036D05837
MKLTTALRSSSALRVAPFAIGIVLFYYFGNHVPLLPNQNYAPTVVVNSIGPISAVTYAVSATVAVWEMGRLKAGAVWVYPGARSRVRVLVNAAVPVVLLGWLMLIVPVALGFAQTDISPTGASLLLLGQQLVLCLAYAAVGFAVGFWTPRLVSAPLLGGLAYYFVAFSVAGESYTWRHLVGYLFEPPMFGEFPTTAALVAPIVLIVSVGAGLTLAWIARRHAPVWCVAGAVMAVGGVVSAQQMVHNWGASTPVVTGAVPDMCTGVSPEVCMPETFAEQLDSVHDQAASVADDLHAAGLASPQRITDRIADGRNQRPSTAETWRAELTRSSQKGNLKFEVAMSSLRFPCKRPDVTEFHLVGLWTATASGEKTAYNKILDRWRARSPQNAAVAEKIEKQVRNISTRPKAEQAHWYGQHISLACKGNR